MNKILWFIAGGIVGGGVSYVITKNVVYEKLNKKFNECLEEIRNNEKTECLVKQNEESDENVTDTKIIFDETENEGEEDIHYDEEDDDVYCIEDHPYIINEDDYGNEEGFEPTDSWNFYSNGYMIDGNGDPVNSETITQMIGWGWKYHFNDNDCAYVRNPKLKTDFEIIMNEEEYQPPTIEG